MNKENQPSARAKPEEYGWEMKGFAWTLFLLFCYFMCGAMPVILVLSAAVRIVAVSPHAFWIALPVGVLTTITWCLDVKDKR